MELLELAGLRLKVGGRFGVFVVGSEGLVSAEVINYG